MRRLYYIVIAFNCLVAAFISRTPYRRLIDEGLFSDSIAADFLSSFFMAVALPFVLLAVFSPGRRTNGYAIIAASISALLLHEFLQNVLPGTFDFSDVIAIIVGGLCALFAFYALFRVESN